MINHTCKYFINPTILFAVD